MVLLAMLPCCKTTAPSEAAVRTNDAAAAARPQQQPLAVPSTSAPGQEPLAAPSFGAPEPKSTVATLGAFGPPLAAAAESAATNASGAAPGQVLLSSVLVAAGGPANAQRVVAGMRAGFRNCYRRELADSPLAGGDVELTLSVDRQGAVSDVTEIHSDNLRTTARCMIARARAAAFDPPGKSPSVIRFRATLKSK